MTYVDCCLETGDIVSRKVQDEAVSQNNNYCSKEVVKKCELLSYLKNTHSLRIQIMSLTKNVTRLKTSSPETTF